MAMTAANTGASKTSIFGWGFQARLILVGLIGLPAILFGVTLPEIRVALNNGSTPRVLAWSEIRDNHPDLVHGYVRVSGILTPTVVTETTKEEGESARTSNTYEILFDRSTHAGLLVGHYGGHSAERTGDPAPATLTGVLTEPKGGILEKVPNLGSIAVNQSCQLVEGKTPGNAGALIAAAAAEVVGFLALAAFAVHVYIIRPRKQAAQTSIQSGTDWKKLRIDD